MRKITNLAVQALTEGNTFKSGNTEVKNNAMFLHGNKIAEYVNNELYIDSCGWLTNTTKERLNSLPDVSIYQKSGNWYLNGQIWDGNRIKI